MIGRGARNSQGGEGDNWNHISSEAITVAAHNTFNDTIVLLTHSSTGQSKIVFYRMVLYEDEWMLERGEELTLDTIHDFLTLTNGPDKTSNKFEVTQMIFVDDESWAVAVKVNLSMKKSTEVNIESQLVRINALKNFDLLVGDSMELLKFTKGMDICSSPLLLQSPT